MKPNNVFDQQGTLNGKLPKTERGRKPGIINSVKVFAERHPRRTIGGMMLFALLNFGLMLYVSGTRDVKPFLPTVVESGKKAVPLQQGKSREGPAFSIGNYMQIARLKDSLDMLMAKKTLTHADTLLALRIFDAYSRLDPSFLPQVTNALKQKGKSQ